eukprot:10048968-Prorocentrum_lima.AAC.1
MRCWQAKRRWRTFIGRPTRRRRFNRRQQSTNRGPRFLRSSSTYYDIAQAASQDAFYNKKESHGTSRTT